MKTISIEDDIYAYIASRTADIGESASQVLRRELNMGSPLKIAYLDEDVYRYLISKIVDIGESASTILRRELGLPAPAPAPSPGPVPVPPTPPSPPAPPPSGPQLIEFHIAAGTGNQPWNTSATRVVGKVGDTLRIFNDDSVAHEVHTGGSPFPHQQSAMQPGTSTDILLQSAFTPTPGNTLYDHMYGPNSPFWIEVKAAS